MVQLMRVVTILLIWVALACGEQKDSIPLSTEEVGVCDSWLSDICWKGFVCHPDIKSQGWCHTYLKEDAELCHFDSPAEMDLLHKCRDIIWSWSEDSDSCKRLVRAIEEDEITACVPFMEKAGL